jgi:hypothetical protein
MAKVPKVQPALRAPAKTRKTAEERRYQARDDLRTLQSAHEIQKDKARYDEAGREAQRQIQALSQVKPRGAR